MRIIWVFHLSKQGVFDRTTPIFEKNSEMTYNPKFLPI